MLVGCFLAVPVVATILIFNFLFNLATNWLPASAFPGLKKILHGYPLRVLTLAAILLVLYFIGLLVRSYLGRSLYQMGDKLLARIPIMNGIYVSVRQISASLFTQRKTLFKEVVIVEYPRKGLYSLAFVTATVPQSMAANIYRTTGDTPKECVSLFIPTTPNPTSGLLILTPRSEVVPLDVPVADALTFIMSAGAVAPGHEGEKTPTLLDKLDLWLKDPVQEKTNAGPPDTQQE